jgi:lipid-A-disaccharide synthase
VSGPVLVAAAETSGDRLAAAIVRGLPPGTRVRALGGPALRAAGAEVVVDTGGSGVVGVVEALASLPHAARARRAAAAELARGPAACVTVDAPSLWLPVAARARAAGVPAIHVVAPQVWAWRPGRVRRVAASVDLLVCLLPFEPPWFAGHVRAVFVGHPAADVVGRPAPAPGSPTIALCPGSRAHEVRALWPTLVAVAREVRRRRPEAGFVVPVAPGVEVPLHEVPGAVAVDGIPACAGADAAVVASGTATLELAVLDVPQVVVYRVHPLTAAFARRALTLRHVALPNVLAGAALAPEHLQDLDPRRITDDVLRWVGVRGQFPRALVEGLRGPGAADRIAGLIGPWLA